MKLVFLGPPAAGKSTQARRVSRELSYFQVSSGNLIRAHIQSGTSLGREVEGYNRRGELVPDEVVIEMVAPNLEPAGRWILDGFPRTFSQARALDERLEKLGLKLTKVLHLEVPDEVLLERAGGRRYSEATGWTYNVDHDPPPSGGQHLDPGPFVRREDDDPPVFRRQLALYHEQTEPLKRYYEEKGILARLNGDRPITEVTDEILGVLGFDDRAAPENSVRTEG